MPLKKETIRIYDSFFKSLFSEKNITNLPTQKIELYRELIFNNIEGILSACFPITQRYLEVKWEKLIKDFIKDSSLQSPYLSDITEEFYNYMQQKENSEFIENLMRYELIELEVFNEDIPVEKAEFNLENRYTLSSSSSIEYFEYPVHKISQIGLNNIKEKKNNYFLIIFQHPDSNEVEYIEITPVLYEFLGEITQNNFEKSLKKLTEKYNLPYEDSFTMLKRFTKYLIDMKILV